MNKEITCTTNVYMFCVGLFVIRSGWCDDTACPVGRFVERSPAHVKTGLLGDHQGFTILLYADNDPSSRDSTALLD